MSFLFFSVGIVMILAACIGWSLLVRIISTTWPVPVAFFAHCLPWFAIVFAGQQLLVMLAQRWGLW